MKSFARVKLTLTLCLLTVALAVFGFAAEVFAQAATVVPAATALPTPRPSGSNPGPLAATDVPVEWSLFWVLMFFLTLAVGQMCANWLVRRGTFEND
ncbi:MAG: hypothetical protein WCS37_07295 [Chloroflexota bacterium]|nr:hypothetical protein [Chloroflexota bacterium]